ncbi:MAG: hypothetical protein ACYDHY_17445 [Acidiferrobacterales bacterium]
MAKYHGSKAKIYAGGYDLSGSTSSLDADNQTEAADVTTFGATAKAFVPGVQISKIKQKTFYDDTAGAIEPMIAAFRGTGGAVATFYPGGDAAGNPGYGSATAEMLSNAVINSPVGGACTLDADWEVSGGAEDVTSVLAKTAETGTGVLAVYSTVSDNGVATTNGASIYFHVTAIDAATTVSQFQVDHSADNVTFVNLTTGMPDTTVPTAVRQATAAGVTVNRYVQIEALITSGKHATLAAALHRG